MAQTDLDQVIAIEEVIYSFPWTRGIFADCLRVGYSCWVVEVGDEIAGYGILSAAAGEAHILNLAVSEDFQKQGHGRYILDKLISIARWHRAEAIFLEVRPSNSSAINLYERAGFAMVGRRPGYYPSTDTREDAIIMTCRLKSAEDSEAVSDREGD